MTVSKTISGKCSRSSDSTSWASRVRSSCMVISRPATSSWGLRSRRIIARVSRNWTRPSSARYSAWTGTITRSAAVRALTLTGPSAGGQSSRVTAKRSRTGPRRSRRRVSEPSIRGSSTAAPARSRLAGTSQRLSGPGRAGGLGDRDVAGQAVVGGGVHFAAATKRHGRVALGVEVDQQRLRAARGDAGGNVDRGRRLADATLLIRHRVDRAHIAATLVTRARWREVG